MLFSGIDPFPGAAILAKDAFCIQGAVLHALR